MKIIYTDKKKPGGIDGSEELNFVDKQKRPWKGKLQDIANLQGYIVKIGEITYADLNELGSSTSLEVEFENAKELNKLYIRGFAKITTPFTNQQYGYSGSYGIYSDNRIIDISVSCSNTLSSSSTPLFPNNEAQNILSTITLENTNLQDWDAGIAEIFIEIKEYPELV